MNEAIMQATATKTWPLDPYKGLLYYGVNDVPLFAGREYDIDAVSRMIGSGNVRILLLHGLTGCGKSSFLRAGLIPALEEEIAGYEFLRDSQGIADFVRSTDDPLAALTRRVHQFVLRTYKELSQQARFLCPDEERSPSASLNQENNEIADQQTPALPAVVTQQASDSVPTETAYVLAVAEDPRRLVRTLEQIASNRPRTFVLVIDQAEEVITLDTTADGDMCRVQFFDFLSGLSRSRHDLKLIVCFRTEYHGQFYAQLRYSADVKRIEDYYLAEFTKEQLVEAILRPTSELEIPEYGSPYDHYRFKYEPDPVLPEQIAADLLGSGMSGGILPALQIVCRRLYEGEKKKAEQLQLKEKSKSPGSSTSTDTFTIKAAAYSSLGGVSGQVIGYVQNELDAALKEEFAADVKFFDKGREIERWQGVLAKLAKPQINGTVTTDVVPVGDLIQKAKQQKCVAEPDKMLAFLADEKRRILRPVEVTRVVSKEAVDCYSLGHDVLASALDQWLARRKLERRIQLIRRVSFCIAALVCAAVGYLTHQKTWFFLAGGYALFGMAPKSLLGVFFKESLLKAEPRRERTKIT